MAASNPHSSPMRWLRATAIGAVLALLLAGGALTWLARSEGGSAWLLMRVPGLVVTGTTGSLQGGPFAAERIEWQLGTRTLSATGLAWQDAQWRWRPHARAWVGLVLVAPALERIALRGAGSNQPLTAPNSLQLPLTLTLQDMRIGSVDIEGLPAITQVAGSATLGARDGAEHRIDTLAFRIDRAGVQLRGSLASDAPFTTELLAQARSLEGSAQPWQASATARGPLAKLALQAQLGSDRAPGATLQAEAAVQPFATWPLATLAATAQGLDLAALGSRLPTTRISGRADIDTRSLDAPVTVRIALANALAGRWDQQRLPVAAFDLELAGQASDRSHLALKAFTLQLLPGAGRIEGGGDWRAATAQLALRLEGVRPALLDARAPAMSLAGSASLDLGGLPSPDGQTQAAPQQTLQARLALDGRLDARSALPVQISATALAERGAQAWQAELRELTMRSGAAHAEGSLSVAQSTAGSWQLKSRGALAGFDPSLWFPGAGDSAWRKGPHKLAGRWRADLQAGTAALAAATTTAARALALRGEAELGLQDSQLAGVPLQGALKLVGRSPGWTIDGDLRLANNRATLQGRYAPRAEDDRWLLSLDAPALAALQPLLELHPGAAAAVRGSANLPLGGQLSGSVQAEGRWPALALDTQVRASALQAAGLRAARLQLQARIGSSAQSALLVQVDGEQLAFGTLRADTLQARAEGSLAEHRLQFDLQSPVRPPAWADDLLGGKPGGSRLVASGQGQWLPADARQGLLPGRWRGQTLQVEARDTKPGSAGTPPWLRARDLRLQLQLDAQGRPLAASAEPGRVEALGATLRWSEASWRAGSAGTADEARLDAELEPLAVVPWLNRVRRVAGLGGNLALAGHAKLTIGPTVAADIVLERAGGDLTLTDDTGTQAFGLSDLRLGLAAQDGTWHFTQALAGSNLGVLAGAQSLRLSPQARWPQAETPMQGVLEWQISDLGAWAPFTPPGWRVSGALRTGAALGGSFGAPEITGEMTGSKLALRNLLQGVDVRDGELAITLRGNQATIERFVVKGGSGELRLAGGARLGSEPSARLQLDAERFQVLGRFDRRIVASGNAVLVLAPQALQLDGKFRVDEGLIDFSRSDAPSLDSDVQVRGGRAAAAASAAAEAEAVAASRSNDSPPRNTRVALQVDLGEQLKLRGRGLDTQLRGNLALSTPGGRLAVNGSVRTEAGSYAAYGQKLAIERGVLAFTGATENPRLDILALRPNLDLRVGVQVSGSAQNPRVRLFSEPEVSDTEKLSWLVLGRAPEGLGSTDTALLQRAALALLAGESEGPAGKLLSNFGLDEFSLRQIESGEVRDTVVSLGKQLSRRWYVGYERGVNATTGTWQLIYRVAQRFTVRAQAGEDNALDAIWTWRWN